MSEELKMQEAQKVYATICSAIENRNWKYEKDEEKLVAFFGVNGDDIPMQIILMVDAKRQVIRLVSAMPFKMSEEKRVEGALAVCAASYNLADGNFDYDLGTGTIMFRLNLSYMGSQIGEGAIQYMISCACAMVDMYNEKFLSIPKGVLSINDFISQEYN